MKGEHIMGRKRYEKAFKLQAAKLVTEHGYSYAEASQRLGVTDWSVRNWVRNWAWLARKVMGSWMPCIFLDSPRKDNRSASGGMLESSVPVIRPWIVHAQPGGNPIAVSA